MIGSDSYLKFSFFTLSLRKVGTCDGALIWFKGFKGLKLADARLWVTISSGLGAMGLGFGSRSFPRTDFGASIIGSGYFWTFSFYFDFEKGSGRTGSEAFEKMLNYLRFYGVLSFCCIAANLLSISSIVSYFCLFGLSSGISVLGRLGNLLSKVISASHFYFLGIGQSDPPFFFFLTRFFFLPFL